MTIFGGAEGWIVKCCHINYFLFSSVLEDQIESDGKEDQTPPPHEDLTLEDNIENESNKELTPR